MRTVTLLIMLLCGLTSSAAPEMSVATGPAPVIIAGAADEADYQALQSEADLALAVLTRAQGQRVAMAQLAAD
jgi:hypothetical protein